MLALTIWLYDKGAMGFEGILTCTIAMMGSFGPVVALSSLSNNLNQTLARIFPEDSGTGEEDKKEDSSKEQMEKQWQCH